jgi:hypothetical protein
MIDINKKALILCELIGKPFDEPTRKMVLELINSLRSTYIRNTISSNKVVPYGLRQTIYKGVETVNMSSSYYIDNTITCVKTINRVESPIRFGTDAPFINISSSSGQITFAHSELAHIKFQSKGKYTNNNRYVYDGQYLYLYSNEPIFLTFPRIKLISIFENPFPVDESGENIYSISNYPLPEDMTESIIRELKVNIFNIPIDNKEVLIDG